MTTWMRGAILLLTALACGACAGSDTAQFGDPASPAPGAAEDILLAQDGFTARVLAESFAPGGSGQFALEVEESANTTAVVVAVTAAAGLKALYVEVDYDAATLTPTAAGATGELGAQVLELAQLAEPGTATHGQVLAHWDEAAGFSGAGELARLTFAHRHFSGERSASSVPDDDDSGSPMYMTTNGPNVCWYFATKGDYDQNGEVAISDLTPVGLHFGETGPFTYYSNVSVIDGDSNGEINIADITAIGMAFGNLVTEYNVYKSKSPEADYPATNGAPPVIPSVTTVAFGSGLQYGAVRKFFTVTLPDPAEPDDVYWVRPSDGAQDGTPSNLSDEPSGLTKSPPVMFAEATPPSGDVPLVLTIDASASYDPDGIIEQYSAFGSAGFDAMTMISVNPQNNAVFQMTLTEPGKYEITVTGYDDDNFAFPSARITVDATKNGNRAPWGDVVFVEPVGGAAPHDQVIDMSDSFDPEGSPLTYEFDVSCYNLAGDPLPNGDFEIDNGANPVGTFTAAEPGRYSVLGRVTDAAGLQYVDFAGQVEITDDGNQVPWVSLGADQYSGIAPFTIRLFSFEGATYDPDGEIVKLEVDPEGDGVWLDLDPVAGLEYTYQAAGTFAPRLRAKDNDGTFGYSSSIGTSITVQPLPGESPVALFSVSDDHGLLSLDVDFDASQSNDPNGTIVRFEWDFDQGSGWQAIASPQVTRTFSIGTYDVRLRVTDNQGLQAITTHQIVVDFIILP